MILRTDSGILEYYQHWIRTHYDVKFQPTVWGAHLSVSRGVTPTNVKAWNKYRNERVEFTYSNEVYRIDTFFCVKAYSTRLEDIREELGLSRIPKHGFHITIGRMNKAYLLKVEEERKFFKGIIDKQ